MRTLQMVSWHRACSCNVRLLLYVWGCIEYVLNKFKLLGTHPGAGEAHDNQDEEEEESRVTVGKTHKSLAGGFFLPLTLTLIPPTISATN